MLVGAWCRDILHAALGHEFATSATRDVDLALGLPSWEIFDSLTGTFPERETVAFGFRSLVIKSTSCHLMTWRTRKEWFCRPLAVRR